jgi:hypothetical protein
MRSKQYPRWMDFALYFLICSALMGIITIAALTPYLWNKVFFLVCFVPFTGILFIYFIKRKSRPLAKGRLLGHDSHFCGHSQLCFCPNYGTHRRWQTILDRCIDIGRSFNLPGCQIILVCASCVI